LSIALPLGANAQTASPSAFTLDDCIKYALENTIEVKNARVDEQIAAAKVKETFGIGLPQIEGSVAVQHNQKLHGSLPHTPWRKGLPAIIQRSLT
jgi:outer membrane protein TolC